MPAWLTALLPVATLILGGILNMWSQAFTDGRARKREKEGRRESFELKRFELERDSLLSLQEAAFDVYQACTSILEAATSTGEPLAASLDQSFWAAHGRMELLAQRTMDEGARQAAERLLRTAFDMKVKREMPDLEAYLRAYAVLQEAIGAALRRDPRWD